MRPGQAAVALAAAAVLAGCGGGAATSVAHGTATMPSPYGRQTVKIDVTDSGGDVEGTVAVASEKRPPWSIDVQCSVQRESALMIGGQVIGSGGSPPTGSRAAAVVRQGTPDRIVIWLEDPPPSDTCRAFLAAIPPGIVTDLQPVTGNIDVG